MIQRLSFVLSRWLSSVKLDVDGSGLKTITIIFLSILSLRMLFSCHLSEGMIDRDYYALSSNRYQRSALPRVSSCISFPTTENKPNVRMTLESCLVM